MVHIVTAQPYRAKNSGNFMVLVLSEWLGLVLGPQRGYERSQSPQPYIQQCLPLSGLTRGTNVSSLGLTLKYNYALSMRAFLLKTGNDSMASGRYLNEYLAHIIRVYLKMRSTSQSIHRRLIGLVTRNYLIGREKQRLWPNLSYYHGIYQEGLKKTMHTRQGSCLRDLSPGPPEYEEGVLTISTRSSVPAISFRMLFDDATSTADTVR
jgi:hypothetical protein